MYYYLNPNILPKVSLINSVNIAPPYVHKRRKADEYIIYIIKNGIMYLKQNEDIYTLVPGDIIFLDPDAIHEGIKPSFCEYYYIHFRHERIGKKTVAAQLEGLKDTWSSIRNNALQSNSFSYELYQTETLLLPHYFHLKNQENFIKIMCLLNEAIEDNKTQLENYKIKCSCKVLEIMIEIERSFISEKIETSEQNFVKSHSKVQDLLNYINVNYSEYLSSMIIEEKFQCNFDYINRIFKQLTGNTIFSYLSRVRIDHSKVLLLTTSLKTATIGEKVGIPDVYYFSKVFKKYTGVSPTRFAKGILKK